MQIRNSSLAVLRVLYDTLKDNNNAHDLTVIADYKKVSKTLNIEKNRLLILFDYLFSAGYIIKIKDMRDTLVVKLTAKAIDCLEGI